MIQETIGLLGRRGKDKVSGFEGVISSAGFDLYGCVQVLLTPPKLPDGKLADSFWFDVHRVELIGKDRVMDVPAFEKVATVSEFGHGPAEKANRT